ncbi:MULTISPECIES: hypothetical protein [Thermotoga]|uniref:S-layer domain-like protein n=1 Tax=Thermotoga neapolitana (strain ATCC 49049 / DSM 4359 / NBRC 107923 / NS-E) TaxID=309803 RepID=B9KAD1_THENN|nr:MULTISPECIES: hypothetical protein [Thermotoga]MDK2785356.1 hypothetical protein [Thermotoga sp.]HBF10673.1 hypothetical protein [Thermotoga neapolitana]ACM23914.1 S-layer domain-like protein [Thermotoga neapolitana DSM 4359]AJG39943.1 hypothetical protein TRQ7_00450 [Thermotoga sp. RQ7]KFZ21018.1 S-layer domain-like protein [Thermotoga neapolitana LA10]
MKYFSRSPEDWKKSDEEKERKERERRNRIRRRANFIVVLNLAIVVFLFFFTKAFFPNRPEGVVGQFQIVIDSKESYLPDEPLGIRVKIYNRERRKGKLVLEDFLFSVKKKENVVYEFHYPQRVEKELDAFESVLVFDLEREVELIDLDGGDYLVTVSMRVNGQRVTIGKIVTVIEEWRVEVDNLKDFYFPYEEIDFSTYLENISSRQRDITVKSVTLKILEEDERTIVEKKTTLGSAFRAAPMGTVEVHRESLSAPERPGDYLIVLELETEEGTLKRVLPLIVTEEYQKNLRGTTLVVEGAKFVSVGERYDFSVKLLNEEKKRKYFVLKSVLIVITRKEPVFSYSRSDEFRIVLDEFSSREIFKTTTYDLIKFDEPGTYRMVVVVESEDDRLVKEMEIIASE